ncbi:MAG: hypothetical protein HQL72_04700 [Magnetococcales bacterium]|nr:hypothetical protein [Magnetococcales bacterium]
MKKKRVWCALSGHGFGHFSQLYPLLNQLDQEIEGLEITLAGTLPSRVVKGYLNRPCHHIVRAQDVGLVQSDPMVVDLPATTVALRAFHHHWPDQLEEEKREMAAFEPDLLLSDIPYLAIEAAHQLGVPTVAIASLSWDHVLAAYYSLEEAEPLSWWKSMRSAYAKTTLALLPDPAIEGDTFPNQHFIPPLTSPARAKKAALRRGLGLVDDDERPLVLVSLGGIPSHSLPIQVLRRDKRFHWLLDCDVPPGEEHLHGVSTLTGWPFRTLSASVDALVSKPGYGMSVASAVDGVPYLYSCRGRFPDEQPISRWLQHNNRAMALDPVLFRSGAWGEALIALMQQTPPRRPPLDGPQKAAGLIKKIMAG